MERINGTDMGIKYGTEGDKMRPLIIHNISNTAISIKVVTEIIVKCAIWVLKG
jgi:hypothetical protein